MDLHATEPQHYTTDGTFVSAMAYEVERRVI